MTEQERFSRLEQLIGANALKRLAGSHAAVVGLGATGSYATEALARSGVGRLTLIDFDTVAASNINRQLYALESTLGRAKAQVAAERVADINPACRVEGVRAFVHRDTLTGLLAERPDVVIDCIDSCNPKVELLAYAVAEGIPAVSCMGAALRTDPSLIRVGTLDRVSHCALARQVRKWLRRRGAALTFPCVYSVEERVGLPESAVGTYDESMEIGRPRRILGSLPTITGIFGLTAANTALRTLMDPAQEQPGERATGS